MVEIKSYMNDGACSQAQAVLTFLRPRSYELGDNADIRVGRFENCREQGYIFTLVYSGVQVAHYTVYQHRNSDNICIIKFRGSFLNTPTLDDVLKDRKDKYDIDKYFDYGEVLECAEWIANDMSGEILKIKEKKEKK